MKVGRFLLLCPVLTVILLYHCTLSVKGYTLNEAGCGKRLNLNARVVGGKVATPHSHPWIVTLEAEGLANYFCAATLITEIHIMSLRKCFRWVERNKKTISDVVARLGVVNISRSDEEEPTRQIRRIKKIVFVREVFYNRTDVPLSNDIIVLRLDKKVVLNGFVNTICLESTRELNKGERVTLAGFGKTFVGKYVAPDKVQLSDYSQVLREATLKTIDNQDCLNSHLAIINGRPFFGGWKAGNDIICTKKETGKGEDGDPGSPVLWRLSDQDRKEDEDREEEEEEEYKQVGIFTYGLRREGEDGNTKVKKFYKEIKEAVENDSDCNNN